MESKQEILEKKIKTKEDELSKIDENIDQLQKKKANKSEEIIKLKNEMAAYRMEEINLVLGERGLKISDILEAVKKGDLESVINKQ